MHDEGSTAFGPRRPRPLAGSSEDELERLLREEDPGNPAFFEAMTGAIRSESPGLLRAVQRRIDRALAEDEPGGAAAPSWVEWAIRPLAETTHPEVLETLYRWAEDPRLTAQVALTLGEMRNPKALPWLQKTVESASMAAPTRSRAAAVLQTHFGEPAGLRHLAPKLAEEGRDGFRCGFDAFFMVDSESRGKEYLEAVVAAAQRQPAADHLVTLMHLLRKAKHPQLVVPVLARGLEDRRRARDLLRPVRRGRVCDFALYHLASNLWPEEGFGRPPQWWVRKLRGSALRRRVRAELATQR